MLIIVKLSIYEIIYCFYWELNFMGYIVDVNCCSFVGFYRDV